MGGGESKYRDIAELGRGGMGEVFLCVASGMAGFSKLLVVKRLRLDLAGEPELLEMFLREAKLAARLSHPNIVQTNDVGFDGHRHYMAMEYLDGQSLATVLRRCRDEGKTLPLAMHLRTLSEVLAGLHYAHELADFDGTPLGIVHRDATPHNIFITYDGQVKLVDFGIAKVTSHGGPETTTGVLKGKVHYMAPEQIDDGGGRARPDRRADIFAVGVMIWEAVTGQRMWRGRSEPQIINLLMNGAIPRPRPLAPDMPEKLEAILDKALAADAAERYATAAELQADLDAFLDEAERRTTAKDVGRFVESLFADTRAHLRKVIDAQLKLAHELPTAPILDLSEHRNQLSPREPESGSKIVVATPASPRAVPNRRALVAAGLVVAAGVALLVLVGRTTEPPQPPLVAGSVDSPAAPPKVVAPSSVGTVVVSAVAPPSAAAIPASATASTELIALTIDAVPTTAKLSLDGVLLKTNPASARYVRDGATHKVTADLPGYVSKSQWVVFDGASAEAHLVLVPIGKPAPVVAPSSAGALVTATASAPPVVGTTAPSSTKPKLPIDKTDPWDTGK